MTTRSDFDALEYTAWQRSAQAYHSAFTPLTRQMIPRLLDALALAPGCTALDIATGPGHVAAAMAERGAEVTALDFSAEMLALVRSHYPGLVVVEGDAQALPFPDGAFYAAAMNFGVLHLSDPHRALREAARVLEPGGRFAFTVWDLPERAIGFRIMLGAIATHGDRSVQLPEGPPFFQFAAPAVTVAALGQAGFGEVGFELVPLTWQLPSPEALFEGFLEGTARTGTLLRRQPAGTLATIKDGVIRELAGYRQSDGGIAVPMSVALAWGRVCAEGSRRSRA